HQPPRPLALELGLDVGRVRERKLARLAVRAFVFERQRRHSPAALEPPAGALLVRDEGFEAREEVGAEAAARRLVAREPAFLERRREEALREILGFLLAR